MDGALEKEGRHFQVDNTNLQNIIRQEGSHHYFPLRKRSPLTFQRPRMEEPVSNPDLSDTGAQAGSTHRQRCEEGINFVFGHHKNAGLVRMECLNRGEEQNRFQR